MPTPYKPLLSHSLGARTSFHKFRQGFSTSVTPDSPALEAMTDLTRVKAITVAPDTAIDLALQKMIHAEVRLLLVIDADGALLGIITARDIMGEKPGSLMAKRQLARHEVLVEHIMTSRDKLRVLRLEEVRNARVGDLILTLKEAEAQHTLVAEPSASDAEIICGIFSTTQIGRQLGMDIQPTGKVQSFAELEAALMGG